MLKIVFTDSHNWPDQSMRAFTGPVVDECTRAPEIQKSLRVHGNFTWQMTVNGHILKSDSVIFSTIN